VGNVRYLHHVAWVRLQPSCQHVHDAFGCNLQAVKGGLRLLCGPGTDGTDGADAGTTPNATRHAKELLQWSDWRIT
jgi:hypothetical protein